jgi:nitrogen-specific signal transduction histidine kinase
MASVVAHEVKNPLAGIAGAIQVIAARLPEGSAERTIIREILARIHALDATVEDLLLFARPRAPRPGALSLGSLIEATTSLLARDPQAAGVQVESSAGDVALWGDPEMLKAVLLNVLINGAQAMAARGASSSRRAATAALRADRGRRRARHPARAARARVRALRHDQAPRHRPGALDRAARDGGARRRHPARVPAEGGTVVTLTLPMARDAAGAAAGAAAVRPADG